MQPKAKTKANAGLEEFERYVVRGGIDLRSEVFCARPQYLLPVPPLSHGEGFLPPNIDAVMRTLLESMIQEVITPLLRAQTKEEFFTLLRDKWHSFCETLNALHVLVARTSSEEKARMFAESAADSVSGAVRQAAKELAGPDGGEEADFALSSYASAARLLSRFASAQPVSEENIERDRALSVAFGTAATIHLLGTMILMLAPAGRPTSNAIELGFEFLRSGALQAYAAVREAWELRSPKETVGEDDVVDLLL